MSVASHYAGSASTYGDQYDPARLFRLELVERILDREVAEPVHELGVANATALAAL